MCLYYDIVDSIHYIKQALYNKVCVNEVIQRHQATQMGHMLLGRQLISNCIGALYWSIVLGHCIGALYWTVLMDILVTSHSSCMVRDDLIL